MKIRKVPLDKIRPAPYNPRLDLKPGDPEYERIKQSIDEFDLVEPLVWNERSGNLIGGHQRLKVLKEKGVKEVEVVVVDLEPKREKALNVALNKVQGNWDFPKLKELLVDIDVGAFDLTLTGFNDDELRKLIDYEGNGKEDEVPPVPKKPKTKIGDLYALGKHRLLCGDSTKAEDVARLMRGEKAEMVMADPPYNVRYTGGSTNKTERLDSYQDDLPDNQYTDWLFRVFANASSASDLEASFHLWFASAKLECICDALKSAQWQRRTLIVWNKLKAHYGALGAHYKHRFEPLFYCHKVGHSPRWYGPSNECTVWDEDQPTVNELHPTMKPVSLYTRSIQNHTQQGDTIFECFLGSGTTIIAAEKTGRVCYGMEIDPRYCDVIVKRWEDFTGKKAKLVNE